jgi:hypothetical protein
LLLVRSSRDTAQPVPALDAAPPITQSVPADPYLTPAEQTTAIAVYQGSAEVKSLLASASARGTVTDVYRNFLTDSETLSSPLAPAAVAVVVVQTDRPVSVPANHPTLLGNTDHIKTSDPRGYEIYIDPGTVPTTRALEIYVDLRIRKVVAYEAHHNFALQHDADEQWPPGYQIPPEVKARIDDEDD